MFLSSYKERYKAVTRHSYRPPFPFTRISDPSNPGRGYVALGSGTVGRGCKRILLSLEATKRVLWL